MSAPRPGPQHRAPRRFTRFQKVSAATGVAAVGVTALAFGLGAGQDGSDGDTTRVTGGEAQVKPVAWQAAERSAGAQRDSVSQQSSHADARAKAEARAEAKKRAAAKKRAEAAKKREHARAEAARRAQAAEAERAAEAKANAEAEAQRREGHQEAASRSAERTRGASASSGSPREIARQIVGDGEQFQCFSQIVERESGWNVTAENPSSGAYGLVQALPGTKMASVGSDWRTNPATQIKWGLNYMNETYGSPCGAWSFWQSHNAY